MRSFTYTRYSKGRRAPRKFVDELHTVIVFGGEFAGYHAVIHGFGSLLNIPEICAIFLSLGYS
jgi:hypothetical protein